MSRYVQRRAAALAAAGYVVLAPEPYWRLDQQVVDEQADGAIDPAMALSGQLQWPTTVADAVSAFDELSRLGAVKGTPGGVGLLLRRRPCLQRRRGCRARRW